jgi:hypothetical protein
MTAPRVTRTAAEAPDWLQPGMAVETEDPTWIAYGHVTFAELWERVGIYLGDPPDKYSDIHQGDDWPVEHLYAVTFAKGGEDWIRWGSTEVSPGPVTADTPGAFPVTVVNL